MVNWNFGSLFNVAIVLLSTLCPQSVVSAAADPDTFIVVKSEDRRDVEFLREELGEKKLVTVLSGKYFFLFQFLFYVSADYPTIWYTFTGSST